MVQHAEWWSTKFISFLTRVGMSPCAVLTSLGSSEFSTSQLGGCFNKWNAKIWKITANNIWTCNSIKSLWWKLVKESNAQLSTNFQVNLLCWMVSSLSLVGIVRWSSIRLLHPTSNLTKNVSPKNVLPISLSLSTHLYIPKFAYWKIMKNIPYDYHQPRPAQMPKFPNPARSLYTFHT